MAVLFTLVHREAGPLAAFDTPAEAAKEMVRVVQGAPELLADLRIERRESEAATPIDGSLRTGS